ncbi:MAG: DUF1840 domain-containing protein [Glaciimonas sp.]|nr:DUF1840 domain-containing protein [Glaciimonas sp.]
MLITFKSKAAAEVVMLEQQAKPFFALLNKDAKIGVITATDIDHAITLLEQEITKSKSHDLSAAIASDIDAHHGDHGDDHDHEKMEHVNYSARNRPLLEMLCAAKKDNVDVHWGY